MKIIKFDLREEDEFITLVNLLKITSVVSSGGEVKLLLANDCIKYNDDIAFQKKKKCFKNDVIIVNDEYEITIN